MHHFLDTAVRTEVDIFPYSRCGVVCPKAELGPAHSSDFNWLRLLPPTGPSQSGVLSIGRWSDQSPGSYHRRSVTRYLFLGPCVTLSTESYGAGIHRKLEFYEIPIVLFKVYHSLFKVDILKPRDIKDPVKNDNNNNNANNLSPPHGRYADK